MKTKQDKEVKKSDIAQKYFNHENTTTSSFISALDEYEKYLMESKEQEVKLDSEKTIKYLRTQLLPEDSEENKGFNKAIEGMIFFYQNGMLNGTPTSVSQEVSDIKPDFGIVEKELVTVDIENLKKCGWDYCKKWLEEVREEKYQWANAYHNLKKSLSTYKCISKDEALKLFSGYGIFDGEGNPHFLQETMIGKELAEEISRLSGNRIQDKWI